MAGKRPGTDDDPGVAETQGGPQYDMELLPRLLNAHDIEEAATRKLSKRAWAYYYSAGDDLISKRFNNTAWQSILLRPRVFVDCTSCDLSTTLLGYKVGTPLFVCPAAQARLGHPSGENGIARGISSFGAIQIVSNSASMTPEQVVEGAEPSQVFGWQLYVQNDREKSEKMLQRVNALSKWYKFVALTVDTAVSGKREDDERQAFSGAPSAVTSTSNGGGAKLSVIQSLGGGLAADITWETTLPWLAEHTKLPIVIKGIQTHEDAELALHYARRYPGQIKGIVLSNHGGRSLDTAPPAVHTLLEIRLVCPEVFSELEVWVDGGIKRGTDIVKALCLGAKAVGIGRLPLYGLAVGGAKGVERVFEILQQEMLTCMRLLGASSIADLNPAMVNTRAVERDSYIPHTNLPSSAKAKL